ncbi:hypothetical protein V8E36_006854 [Tilletia maclaganii]
MSSSRRSAESRRRSSSASVRAQVVSRSRRSNSSSRSTATLTTITLVTMNALSIDAHPQAGGLDPLRGLAVLNELLTILPPSLSMADHFPTLPAPLLPFALCSRSRSTASRTRRAVRDVHLLPALAVDTRRQRAPVKSSRSEAHRGPGEFRLGMLHTRIFSTATVVLPSQSPNVDPVVLHYSLQRSRPRAAPTPIAWEMRGQCGEGR